MTPEPLSVWRPLVVPFNGAPETVEIRVGIDSVSLGFRTALASELEWQIGMNYLDGPEQVPGFRGLRRGRMTRRPIAGFHVGAFHADDKSKSLAFVEGRLANFWHPGESELAATGALWQAESASRQFLGSLGIPADQYPCPDVRRLDITADIRCSGRSAIGRQLIGELAGLASTCDRRIYLARKTTSTITGIVYSLRDGIHARIYDKSLQTGTAAPGSVIRIERQIRWVRKDRPTLNQWLDAGPELGTLFASRYLPWGGTSADGTLDAIVEALGRDELTQADARTVAGFVELTRRGLHPPLSQPLRDWLGQRHVRFNPFALPPLAATVLDASVAELDGRIR